MMIRLLAIPLYALLLIVMVAAVMVGLVRPPEEPEWHSSKIV